MHDEVGDFPRQATYAHEHVKCKSNKPAKKSVTFTSQATTYVLT